MEEDRKHQRAGTGGRSRKEERRDRREKERQWRASLETKLSAEKYAEYVRREQMRSKRLRMGLAGAGVMAAAIVALAGLSAYTGRSKEAAANQLSASVAEDARVYQERDITLGSTGCMLLHSPFINSYPDAEGNYDFSSIYKYIAPYYSKPDFMTCEFEGTLAGKEMGYSGYPNFKSPDAIIENIRDSGVDLQLLATNHCYDGLSEAFHRTMQVYDEKGIAYTGMRQEKENPRYYVADIQGVCVGFLDYTYETSGDGVNLNAIPVAQQDWELVNSFDYDDLDAFYDEVRSDIAAMRAEGVRFIVVNLHWGDEYHLKESETQRKIAQDLCDLGVDALIGGHPHCLQPIDVFESPDGGHAMFCIFSVGNALSNQRTYLLQNSMPDGHTEDGVLVTLTLHQAADGTVTITDIDVLPTWVYRFQQDGSKYYILPLDDVEHLAEKTGITDLGDAPANSYRRTMEELGEGLEKAQDYFKRHHTGTSADAGGHSLAGRA